MVRTPEEEVRQAFAWFLTSGAAGAATWNAGAHFLAEWARTDIAMLQFPAAVQPQLRVTVPVAVVETKRRGVTLSEHEPQIRKYMVRDRFEVGVLFSGDEAYLVEHADAGGGCQRVLDLQHIERRVDEAFRRADQRVHTFVGLFNAANSGSFDALHALIGQLGERMELPFNIVERRGAGLRAFQAICVSTVDSSAVEYFERGVTSRRKIKLDRSNFHSLESVG